MRKTKLLILVEGGVVQGIRATSPQRIKEAYVSDYDKHGKERVLVSKCDITPITEKELTAILARDARRRWTKEVKDGGE